MERIQASAARFSKDHSGLVLVEDNTEALAARVWLARTAKTSLDLMYYIWHDDLAGRTLLEEVLAAADRGVRVRLLIDDINPQSSDAQYLRADAHPNVEVRLFNPSGMRTRNIFRGLELVSRMFAMTRRMHMKAWIADGSVAIVGGRNIGNAYFGNAETNFSDLDLLIAGEVVAQTCRVFETYWTFQASRPVRTLHPRHVERDQHGSPTDQLMTVDPSLASGLLEAQDRVRWVKSVRLLADPPEKVLGKSKPNWLMYELQPLLHASRQTLEIVSPYFIPGIAGVEILRQLATNGVTVQITTNSLAATDVAAVHGAYANYRKDILRAGVKLYEFQPKRAAQKISAFGSKGASLHTKAFAIDDTTGFVGSFNFDPRSATLNSEMGILFEDEELVGTLRRKMARDRSADISYHVSLHGNDLRWVGRAEGRHTEYDHDPNASLRRRLLATIVSWLPIESQL